MNYNLITILGPTASGKTTLATHIAQTLGSGVISADSRQVYKQMDIGTGKDLGDYKINNNPIPYYLIDICNAGEKYNVYEFQKDFIKVFSGFAEKNVVPVLCGGSGLYIEAVLMGYRMLSVPINEILRNELSLKSDNELSNILANLKKLHNTTDITTKKRLIRAIEIEQYQKDNKINSPDFPNIKSLIVGINFERNELKQRITQRLKTRLESGMIEEVRTLLESGIFPEDLIYYGLEYKFITLYLTNQLSYTDMISQLNIAIHQFSKRQMTWFRKMEREGFKIQWIDGNLSLTNQINKVLELFNQ